MIDNQGNLLSIDEISRDTGLGKDQLRTWERRYGFPQPVRDSHGQRQYNWQQLECLRKICRLIDQGHRPGSVLKQGVCEQLLNEGLAGHQEAPKSPLDHWLLMDHQQFILELSRYFSTRTLPEIIDSLVEPLVHLVGQRWAMGQLSIHQEHRISHCLQSLLSHRIMQIPSEPEMPCLLFSTVPGERHSIGLLMAESRMRLSGCRTINMGCELPLDELARAAEAHEANGIVLSFSSLLSRKDILASVSQLKQQLQTDVQIIAGGSGVSSLRRMPEWLQVIRNKRELNALLKCWKQQSTL